MGGEREKNKRNIILSCKGKHDRSLNKPLEGEKKQQSNFPIETDFLRGEKYQIC